jgi:hypothetical protein
VRIAHRRDDAALAWLLGGWLLAAGKGVGTVPDIEQSAEGDAIVVVTLGLGSRETTLTLTDYSVVVAEENAPPLTVGVPIEPKGDAAAAELRTLSQDPDLHAALAALVRHFAGA